MTNTTKGEFQLTFGGKPYRFRLGTAALTEMQEHFCAPDNAARLRAESEVERLRQALMRFGSHQGECKGKPCACGFSVSVVTADLTGVIPQPQDLLAEVMRGRLKYAQVLLWASLRKYHPDVTLEKIADLMDEASQDEVQTLLVQLGMSTVPNVEDVKELKEGATSRPRRARKTGTGANSTSKPEPSV